MVERQNSVDESRLRSLTVLKDATSNSLTCTTRLSAGLIGNLISATIFNSPVYNKLLDYDEFAGIGRGCSEVLD
jgi:hypothetical protein